MKTQVLETIGETQLSRPGLVNAALAANDRLKYYFSVLQMALAHADHPEQPAAPLRHERVACGIDDARLDDIVASAQREGGRYRVPGCAPVLEAIARDLRVMAEPVLAARLPGGPSGTIEERVQHALTRIPNPQDALLDAATVYGITRAGAGQADSVHQLVMDLHKALNAMQAELAEERLDGAAVYQVAEGDRILIKAFMAGLNRTAPLKFGHPGLGTTATRIGGTLVIQNDIGTTDAHVIVIRIEGMSVQVTYTDVHPERMQFLRDTLKPYAVSWGEDRTNQAASIAGGQPFYMATGRFQAKDAADLQAYLGFLASRLVFLIDWNRARKQLRGFLRGEQRVALLRWAAEAEVGHRGFLELGGARLINRAIEATAGSATHFGDRLCDVLGDVEAMNFVRFVLRAAAEGLRDRQSLALIQDRIRAELQVHFTGEEKRLLRLAGDHAAMIFEIASLVRDGIEGIKSGAGRESYQRLAGRARRFEHEADQLLLVAREAAERRPEYKALFRVVETADDASDELEEVAFLLPLLVQTDPGGEVLDALGAFADLLAESTQEWIKALAHAVLVGKPDGGGLREEAGDFLTAINAVFALEHRADDAERMLTHAAVRHASDFRQLHLYAEMGRSLEAAADSLKWAGLIAREYLLGTVLGA